MTTFEEQFNAQMKLFGHISHFVKNSREKITADKRTLPHYRSPLELLQAYWYSFFNIDVKSSLQSGDPKNAGHAYFAEDKFSIGESEYVSAKITIEEAINKFLTDADADALQASGEYNTYT